MTNGMEMTVQPMECMDTSADTLNQHNMRVMSVCLASDHIMTDAVDRHTRGLREHVHGHHVGAGETMEYLVGKA